MHQNKISIPKAIFFWNYDTGKIAYYNAESKKQVPTEKSKAIKIISEFSLTEAPLRGKSGGATDG
jgi:hypothetical protein